jgi:hypothetical protein
LGSDFAIAAFHRAVLHDGPGRFPEHIGQFQVHRFFTRLLAPEHETVIPGNLPDQVNGRPLAFRDPHQAVHLFRVQDKSHAFL